MNRRDFLKQLSLLPALPFIEKQDDGLKVPVPQADTPLDIKREWIKGEWITTNYEVDDYSDALQYIAPPAKYVRPLAPRGVIQRGMIFELIDPGQPVFIDEEKNRGRYVTVTKKKTNRFYGISLSFCPYDEFTFTDGWCIDILLSGSMYYKATAEDVTKPVFIGNQRIGVITSPTSIHIPLYKDFNLA